MGMTINDNVDFLNEAKKLFEDIANDPSINETIKTYFIIESLENARDIICKYQKIEQIIKDHDNDRMPEDYWYIDKIREVVEDGNNGRN